MSKEKCTPDGSSKKTAEVSLVRSSLAKTLTFVVPDYGSEVRLEMRHDYECVWHTNTLKAALYDVSIPASNQQLEAQFERQRTG